MATHATAGRRRWVAEFDGAVVGTSLARLSEPGMGGMSIAIRPDSRLRGAGSGLLEAALTHLAELGGVDLVRGICNGDETSLSFADHRGFEVTGRHQISRVDTRTVAAPAAPASGAPAPAAPPPGAPRELQLVRCSDLPDLGALLDTHNRSAGDDPRELSQAQTLEEFHRDWWDSPDNAPDLSWASSTVRLWPRSRASRSIMSAAARGAA